VHPHGFGGPNHCTKIVRILHPVQDDEKRRLAASMRVPHDVQGIGIPLGCHDPDNTLMFASRYEPIQCLLWLDVDGDPRGSSQPHDIGKLTILSQDQNPQKRSGPCSKRFPYSTEAIDDLACVIASTGWCHLADPLS
jgi:hypothetical protein